jgi:hypothetical protein
LFYWNSAVRFYVTDRADEDTLSVILARANVIHSTLPFCAIVSRGHQQLMEVMDRSVRLHLCRDTEALMIRFLSGFTVDGLSKPWWAFAAGKYRFPPLRKMVVYI